MTFIFYPPRGRQTSHKIFEFKQITIKLYSVHDIGYEQNNHNKTWSEISVSESNLYSLLLQKMRIQISNFEIKIQDVFQTSLRLDIIDPEKSSACN